MSKKKSNLPQPRSEVENFVDFERRKYAREWEISSKHLAETGCYGWMAEKLNASGLLLEIGCGNGQSTIELLRRGNRVVAVEENTACMRRAKQAIEEANFRVKAAPRGAFKTLNAKQHKITYGDITAATVGDFDVVLIEGNLFDDPKLQVYLRSIAPFDGVVCWLIGTHGGMGTNAAVDRALIQSPLDYRLLVQNDAYEQADGLLKPGGVLQIVDRAQALTTAVIEDTLETHKDQASETSLLVTDIDHRPYEEPQHAGAVQMGMTLPDGRTRTELQVRDLSLISIRSAKPFETDES